MAKPRWFQKLLDTTRGQILSLLRTDPRTVSEMAERLDLSGNAVRRHLTALERDGLVETSGVRREGVGKPARIYGLTDEARDFFPRAYGAVLNELLAALEERDAPEDMERLLREVGRSLAARSGKSGGSSSEALEDRVRDAARFLEDIGGVPRVERTNGDFRITGESCPLAEIVEEHPGACSLAEALLEELLDIPVSERCRKNGRPSCVFEIAGGGGG